MAEFDRLQVQLAAREAAKSVYSPHEPGSFDSKTSLSTSKSEQPVEPAQLIQRAHSQEDSSGHEPGSFDSKTSHSKTTDGSPEVAPAVEVATEETTVGVDGEAKALGSVDHAGAPTEVEQCAGREGGVGRGGKKRASRKVKVKNGDGSQV